MIDEKKLIEAITNGEYTTGNILLDMELEQFIKDFPKIVTAGINFQTVNEMGKDVANRAMDEYLYNGKTLRQWVDEIQKYQWIPCSERLPEDRKEKMVYLSSSRITIAKYNEHRLPHTGYPIGWGYIPKNGYIDFENETVIAWMPLPEPYNSKGE